MLEIHFVQWSDKYNFWLDLRGEWQRLCPYHVLEDIEIQRGDALTEEQEEVTLRLLLTDEVGRLSRPPDSMQLPRKLRRVLERESSRAGAVVESRSEQGPRRERRGLRGWLSQRGGLRAEEGENQEEILGENQGENQGESQEDNQDDIQGDLQDLQEDNEEEGAHGFSVGDRL